jgi:hypothetical protein
MKSLSLIITVLILLAFASHGLAQEAAQPATRESVLIHPKLPPYIFEIESKEAGEITIKITGGPKNFHGQTITANVEDEKRHGFQLVDVNFDGYEDFSVVEHRGATGNVNYAYWVFDPKTDGFKEASEFDDITYVDQENKLLVSHSKGGNIETITEYYRVEHGKPVPIKSVQTTWAREVRDILPSNYPYTTVRITRIYKNGRISRMFYGQMDE